MNESSIYVGVDNRHSACVRVVCLGIRDRLLDTVPCIWEGNHELKMFQAFWRAHLGSLRPTAAAAPLQPPYDIPKWLETQGIPVESYTKKDLRPGDFDQAGHRLVPRFYRHAYALALRVAYEYEGSRVVEEVWSEMQDLRGRVHQLDELVGRLIAVSECPF